MIHPAATGSCGIHYFDHALKYLPGKYPVTDRLLAAIQFFDMRVEVLPSTPELEAISFRGLVVHAGSRTWNMWVEDEFGDGSDESNTAMLLHLVLRECEYYEDCGDFPEWCREHELDAGSALALDIYRDLGRTVPAIREMLGPHIGPVDEYHYQLSAGETQVLRNMGTEGIN